MWRFIVLQLGNMFLLALRFQVEPPPEHVAPPTIGERIGEVAFNAVETALVANLIRVVMGAMLSFGRVPRAEHPDDTAIWVAALEGWRQRAKKRAGAAVSPSLRFADLADVPASERTLLGNNSDPTPTAAAAAGVDDEVEGSDDVGTGGGKAATASALETPPLATAVLGHEPPTQRRTAYLAPLHGAGAASDVRAVTVGAGQQDTLAGVLNGGDDKVETAGVVAEPDSASSVNQAQEDAVVVDSPAAANRNPLVDGGVDGSSGRASLSSQPASRHEVQLAVGDVVLLPMPLLHFFSPFLALDLPHTHRCWWRHSAP